MNFTRLTAAKIGCSLLALGWFPASASITTADLPGMGLFKDYSIFEFGNGQVNLSSFRVFGSIAKSAGTHADDIDLSSSMVTGNIYKDSTATLKESSSTHGNVINQDMSAAKAQAIAASTALAGLPADYTYTGFVQSLNLNKAGDGAKGYVINFQDGFEFGNFTLTADPGDFFIFNVSGNTVKLNDANFNLNGVRSSDLLFNVIGSGSDIALKGTVYGSWLAPSRWIDPDSVRLYGSIWGGNTVDADSGVIKGTVFGHSFQPVPVPEASTVIAGLLLMLPFTVSVLRTWQQRRKA